jgi:hypothetical protein
MFLMLQPHFESETPRYFFVAFMASFLRISCVQTWRVQNDTNVITMVT